MIALRQAPTQPQEFDKVERLVRHRRRPEWGIGVWMREERTRRRIVFGDGKMRVFKRGFYHLLAPVDPAKVNVHATFDAIVAEREAALVEQRRVAAALRRKPLMTFEQQLEIMRRVFPAGFADPAWRDAHRSRGDGGKPLKRHIDAVIERAQQELAQAALKPRVTAEPSAVVDDCAALLERCRFVERREVQPLRELDSDARADFAQGLFEVLWGKGTPAARMGAWITLQQGLLGRDLGWELATALPALVHPTKQACVKHKVLEVQARAVTPEIAFSSMPSELAYRKALRVAVATRDALLAAGLQPRDLFDVRIFAWETLRARNRAKS